MNQEKKTSPKPSTAPPKWPPTNTRGTPATPPLSHETAVRDKLTPMSETSERLPTTILVRSPEIILKRRNQGEFWKHLSKSIEHALGAEGIDWPVKTARYRIEVEAGDPSEEALERALTALGRVAGIDTHSAAARLSRNRYLRADGIDRAAIERAVLEMALRTEETGASFAVRAHRVDKRFPMSSSELERWLGQSIRERTSWDRVHLDAPDRTFHLAIYAEAIFFFCERRSGIGGLPVGTSGRVLSLLSGGIDSPVASFLIARRGTCVDWLHVSAAHASERDFETSVVAELARLLSRYTVRSRLFVVPYTYFDLALSGASTGYEPVLFRRFLFRLGEALAERLGAEALISGDSLAQVASQTLYNLVATEEAVSMLVLRPLIGMDKQQIMDLAREVGTYETSIRPYKDCCALYGDKVRTRARSRTFRKLERRLFGDPWELVERSLEDAIWAEYDTGRLVATHGSLQEAETPATEEAPSRG